MVTSIGCTLVLCMTGWNNGAKHNSPVSEEVHNDTAV